MLAAIFGGHLDRRGFDTSFRIAFSDTCNSEFVASVASGVGNFEVGSVIYNLSGFDRGNTSSNFFVMCNCILSRVSLPLNSN